VKFVGGRKKKRPNKKENGDTDQTYEGKTKERKSTHPRASKEKLLEGGGGVTGIQMGGKQTVKEVKS